jgi:hypothetical protein
MSGSWIQLHCIVETETTFPICVWCIVYCALSRDLWWGGLKGVLREYAVVKGDRRGERTHVAKCVLQYITRQVNEQFKLTSVTLTSLIRDWQCYGDFIWRIAKCLSIDKPTCHIDNNIICNEYVMYLYNLYISTELCHHVYILPNDHRHILRPTYIFLRFTIHVIYE